MFKPISIRTQGFETESSIGCAPMGELLRWRGFVFHKRRSCWWEKNNSLEASFDSCQNVSSFARLEIKQPNAEKKGNQGFSTLLGEEEHSITIPVTLTNTEQRGTSLLESLSHGCCWTHGLSFGSNKGLSSLGVLRLAAIIPICHCLDIGLHAFTKMRQGHYFQQMVRRCSLARLLKPNHTALIFLQVLLLKVSFDPQILWPSQQASSLAVWHWQKVMSFNITAGKKVVLLIH